MPDRLQDEERATSAPRARRREGRMHERSLALFASAIVAFTPPLLMVFDRKATVFGLPMLYLYLFAVWAALIALAGRIAARWRRPPPSAGRR